MTSNPPSDVALQSLEAGSAVTIRTRNSEYRVVVLNSARRRVLVRGGILPEHTPACLQGASAGGCVLKAGWIAVGLRLEMSIGARRLLTSPVQSIAIESPPVEEGVGSRELIA